MKSVPLLPHLFDGLLRLHLLVFKPSVLSLIDEIETEVSKWKGVKITSHKYGGLQFNYKQKEIGHIHGNGMLDVLLNKTSKQYISDNKRVREHHSIKSSGWISFSIVSNNDVQMALKLLAMAYNLRYKNQSDLYIH
ncbi:luciferase domain-containing protein [Mucilaginibacter aquatilis]|uniref:Luciferase domain-containing protein n=1 Tax=Mucilaginibacter aquatilis TaxID=1517760 RepID=A0A6I4I6E9_9SPHI|nr:luciferase family protein [Mucilaginibacter aquatilis]MVN90661.1 hypothetical protein [Mucilaginibacter aquatilis]